MPYVSSSGKLFHLDGPNRKLEQKAKPLLLVAAVLICFLTVVRQGTAAAVAGLSAARPAAASFVQDGSRRAWPQGQGNAPLLGNASLLQEETAPPSRRIDEMVEEVTEDERKQLAPQNLSAQQADLAT